MQTSLEKFQLSPAELISSRETPGRGLSRTEHGTLQAHAAQMHLPAFLLQPQSRCEAQMWWRKKAAFTGLNKDIETLFREPSGSVVPSYTSLATC